MQSVRPECRVAELVRLLGAMKLFDITKPAAGVFVTVVWSVVFWYLFFVLLSWHILKIPLGLGGAIYPVFFFVPVLVGSVVYQAVVAFIFRPEQARRYFLLWRFFAPCVITSLLLAIFCPMDVQSSYLSYLWHLILNH